MSATCPTCDRDGFKNNRGVELHHVSVHEAVLIDWTECSWCSSPIIDDPRSPGGEYCSPECSQKASSENLRCEKIEVHCDWCGEDKRVYPYRYSEERRYYCDEQCQGAWLSENKVGEDHPLYQGGGEWTDKFGSQWHVIREEQINRDDRECIICGITRDEHYEEYGFDLNVHHKVPRRKYYKSGKSMDEANRPDNLVTLCKKHHVQAENGVIEV